MIGKKTYAVDIDGTLTLTNSFPKYYDLTPNQMRLEYAKVKPNVPIIKKVNRLFCEGNEVILFTSRSDMFKAETIEWLKANGVQYDEIIFNKPYYDYIIDDKSLFLDSINYAKQ